MAQNIGRFFITTTFGDEASDELFEILEDAAKEKFPSLYTLHQHQNEWDLDRMFITVDASIANYRDDEEKSVTVNFHVNSKGEINNITMEA